MATGAGIGLANHKLILQVMGAKGHALIFVQTRAWEGS